MRRYAVEAASGERCVMTLALEHGGVGAPLPPAADDGQQQQDAQQQPAGSGRGWVLVSATGEPALPGTPARPAPEHPPEAVVAAQLAALRSLDARAAWRFVGLRGRPALGGGADGFYARLESADLAPLLMHGGAATVMRRQRGARVYSEVARVEANGGGARTQLSLFGPRAVAAGRRRLTMCAGRLAATGCSEPGRQLT